MSILVYAENFNGSFKKATFETLTYANETASKLGVSCIAVTVGELNEGAGSLSAYGVEKIISISNQFNSCDNTGIATALAEVAKNEGSTTFILSNSNSGKSIGPRIAVKLGASFISNVVAVPSESSPLKVKKKAFSGKAFEEVESKTEKCILALSPNSFHVRENPNSDCILENHTTNSEGPKITYIKEEKANGKISLAEAEVVISAGRGLKGPENWTMVEELADLLNAGTACSKPVSDIGWRPHGEHVGQTGKAIAPNLYVAIGISGAIQHLAGINSSKVIVAINTDAEAPFFKAADYGIVGDAFEVVPKLIEEIKKFKENN
jgi:electron transfer flavoprotein alpha subunit